MPHRIIRRQALVDLIASRMLLIQVYESQQMRHYSQEKADRLEALRTTLAHNRAELAALEVPQAEET